MFVMRFEDIVTENMDKWKALVLELGGQWVDVQQGFQDAEPFVLFVAPHSMSPIRIPVSQMTPEVVKQKMGIKITPNVAKQTQVNFTLDRIQEHVRDLTGDLVSGLNKIILEIEELRNAEK